MNASSVSELLEPFGSKKPELEFTPKPIGRVQASDLKLLTTFGRELNKRETTFLGKAVNSLRRFFMRDKPSGAELLKTFIEASNALNELNLPVGVDPKTVASKYREGIDSALREISKSNIQAFMALDDKHGLLGDTGWAMTAVLEHVLAAKAADAYLTVRPEGRTNTDLETARAVRVLNAFPENTPVKPIGEFKVNGSVTQNQSVGAVIREVSGISAPKSSVTQAPRAALPGSNQSKSR